jgi:hypothetical protein
MQSSIHSPHYLSQDPPQRRSVLKGLLGTAVLASSRGLLAQRVEPVVRITGEEISRIPDDFTGLSYESSQLAHPRFFSADNHMLMQFFRTLNPRGVLRLGGNMSEFTRWMPTASPDSNPDQAEGPDPGFGSDRVFPITPEAIDNLAGFLRGTGWKLIYGLNLARGEASSAVEEAKYVANAAGDRLIALQFGNEPDLFKHDGDKNRKWTYDEFITKWKEFDFAIRRELPNVPIAGPDTSSPKWNSQFAQDVGHAVALQTSHFYAEGPPTDPRMTIDYLLNSGDRLQAYALQAMELSKKSGVPYRMAEGNSCYAAGKAGVSDTFASALWVADFMLAIGQAGASGVNLHGGGNGLYTPIAGSPHEGYMARPIYYGMLLVSQFLGATQIRTEVESGAKSVSAYSARTIDSLRIIVINREKSPVSYRVIVPAKFQVGAGIVWRLRAPSVSSKADVTLANASVSSSGIFHAAADEMLRFRHDEASLHLASYSASLVSIPLEKKNA